MDQQQISNLQNIQRASRENRLVVFVGAGVSMNSGIPSWNKLIEEMKKDLPKSFSEETDALKIAQIYEDSHGHKEYMDKVKEVLLYNRAVPNPLHKSILSLNPCHIITTNYDDLIEQELSNEFLQFHIIREDKDMPQMACPNSLVKMHGDYTKDNIVLTESDYYNYKDKFPLIRAFVQSLFASKLVLFVGFSFADLNLKMILNELQNILSENMQRAYILSCEKPTYVTRQYYEKKGINVLYLSENDADVLNDNSYNANNNLTRIGLHTDKMLYAINNYSATSKKDLAQYLYERIVPYMDEIRSFGDGLKYFFPKNREMSWNAHSEGLQTNLGYFKKLSEELKTNQAKRQFLLDHPSINVRNLLRIAYYNYLYEIDRVKIIDEKYVSNLAKYIDLPALYYIHRFDSDKVRSMIKDMHSAPISYTIKDLELPYTLFALGDAREAYQQYLKLLPLYWNKQKYLLYFLCRYNLWAIRHSVYFQLMFNKELDAKNETELAYSTNLDIVLSKLPLPAEIKSIFHDVISYRFIGSKTLDAGDLNEKIYQDRKSAEKGGCSINSNILRLMSIYDREFLFSWANFIIWENNNYFKLISEYNALGILNSFATPSATMFGGFAKNTKITALDDSMLETLIFSIENKRLREIIKGYKIRSLKFDEDGLKYINVCLSGLVNTSGQAFRDSDRLYNPLNNLILIISKSEDEKIEKDTLYKVLIRYQSQNRIRQFDNRVLEEIIAKYPPEVTAAKDLLWKLLVSSSDNHGYLRCIFDLTKALRGTDVHLHEFKFHELQDKNKIVTEISLLYPIASGELKEDICKFSLAHFKSLYDYIYFVKSNNIETFSVERLKELLDKEKTHLESRECKILAEVKSIPTFNPIYGDIDKIAKENDCLSFYLSPFDYKKPEKVKMDWLLDFDSEKRKILFKNSVYKETLKHYILKGNISDSDKEYLMRYL